jgi:formyl-CoA transferase
MIQAQGGLMSLNGPMDGEPYKVGVAIVDITAGMYAANAILGALNYRTQTGEGQYIDIALLDTQIAWLINVAQNYFATGAKPKRYGNAHPNIVPYEVFPTRDGHLALAIGTDDQFQRFCETVNRADLWEDERFRTNSGRVQHRQILISILQDLFRERKTEEWINLCVKYKIPVGPINDVPAVLNDPQVKARGMVQEINHPKLGTIKQLGPVARFSKTPALLTSAPPLLGEHTESILRDNLGYEEANIAQLRAEGII